ncbi:hypothetical protein [Aurantimonas sp. VKM B-3413]|uniref:hypothetical protein n=1 Tax=Aurantimonas sp. VKM B-3413 TaxID=2779401 RepID=UPI001E4AE827|nr:hypothetical protein [Aurantimonas sp. VKM B-3413]MCB8839515.1 hypothetical protein [Aurantimonas sp. VKM B-3413]
MSSTRKVQIFVASILLLFAIWILSKSVEDLSLVAFKDGDIFLSMVERLGTFLILALFVERATEVYVTFVLGTKEEDTERTEAVRRRWAMGFSLLFSAFLGLCGVSVVGALLADQSTMHWPLRLADVLLVASLLSGGADPIHQIVEALSLNAEVIKKAAEKRLQDEKN